MKGIFNKTLSLALLISVAGMNAGPDGLTISTLKLAVPAVEVVKTGKLQAVKNATCLVGSAIKTGAIATKNGVVAVPGLVKSGAIATKNGVVAVPGLVKSGAIATKNGVYAVPGLVKSGAIATKNGVVYAGTKSFDGVKYVGSKSLNGVKYAGSAVKTGAIATKNGVVAVPGLVKSGAIATKNGVYAVPGLVKSGAIATKNGVVYAGTKSFDGVKYVGLKSLNGVKYAGSAVKAGAIATKNGVVYAGTKSLNGVKYVGTKSFDGLKYAGSAVVGHPYIAGGVVTVAGLGVAGYMYRENVKNFFKGKEDSVVVFFKSQIVEMNKVLAALEKNEDVVFNDFYLMQGSGLTQKADFDTAFAAYSADKNDTNKAALVALVKGIVALAESCIK